MKAAILVYSSHHGNTRKLAERIAAKGADLIDVTAEKERDLSGYDLIGAASGVYGGSFGMPMLNFLEANLPEGKDVFFVYTYAVKMGHYLNAAKKVTDAKKARIVGEYSCQGYNTFGPFKLIGGTARNHPTDEEIEGAGRFFEDLAKRYGGEA